AHDAERNSQTQLSGFFGEMWIAPAVAALGAIEVLLLKRSSLVLTAPMIALWLVSPAVAWWISKPILARAPRLSDAQTLFLRKLTRRTWRFFEAFITSEGNYLPPDNYQE